MSVEQVEVLVEEPSMEAALRVLLPKLVGGLSFEVHSHQGKRDLLARLPDQLRGYAAWIPSTWRIVVVVDRDDQDCGELKAALERVASSAGLSSGSTAIAASSVLFRIAIEELEAWYFGDWQAVRAAYPRVSTAVPRQAAYRRPDAISGGTWEAFERILTGAGYFEGGLRKIEAARAVAGHMVPSRNRSESFCALRDALAALARPIPALTPV